MVGRNSIVGILIGVSVGTLSLVLASPPQAAQPASCADVGGTSLSEDLIRCAELGDAFAQSRLGGIYYNGWGVTTDPAEGVRWFRLAADQGVAEMQSLLGMMYDNGRSVQEDDAEAVRWFRLAAEQGDAFAQWSLGTMYSRGEGVPEDLVLAYMWFNLAAAQGYEIKQGNKDIVEQLMTREQVAEAQKMSREWIETHPQDGGNSQARALRLRSPH